MPKTMPRALAIGNRYHRPRQRHARYSRRKTSVPVTGCGDAAPKHGVEVPHGIGHRVPRASSRRATPGKRLAVSELLVGSTLIALVALLTTSGWSVYARYVMPAARIVPTATPTPHVDAETVRAQAQRARQVLDHLGAGATLRQSGERGAAIEQFMKALELDPGNAEARAHLVEMGIVPPPGRVATPPPPTPTPVPTQTPRVSR